MALFHKIAAHASGLTRYKNKAKTKEQKSAHTDMKEKQYTFANPDGNISITGKNKGIYTI